MPALISFAIGSTLAPKSVNQIPNIGEPQQPKRKHPPPQNNAVKPALPAAMFRAAVDRMSMYRLSESAAKANPSAHE
ncbi:MAG: hypothetical protein EKK48_24255 [Candidatus Melainabacteria bacterium]|jgi:hypothetical protein|nr:MAG: hypothetical protein EKK48_24255 [Candidatus Melainabacteria bacterium]